MSRVGASVGPDRLLEKEVYAPNYQLDASQHFAAYAPWLHALVRGGGGYDPTNGSVSRGDIFRSAKGDYPTNR